ncbi:protein LITTLE ZIPPER 1 [Dendrobium catenatum]|nr:protein LITTLE ZIPPER 1 [Dendrobium catenatum]
MCSSQLISFGVRSSPHLLKRFLKKAKLTRFLNSKAASSMTRRSMKRSQSLKGEKMKMMNLKLYLKNKCIMEENMMLRKKALLLSQENKALLSYLQASNKSNGKFL